MTHGHGRQRPLEGKTWADLAYLVARYKESMKLKGSRYGGLLLQAPIIDALIFRWIDVGESSDLGCGKEKVLLGAVFVCSALSLSCCITLIPSFHSLVISGPQAIVVQVYMIHPNGRTETNDPKAVGALLQWHRCDDPLFNHEPCSLHLRQRIPRQRIRLPAKRIRHAVSTDERRLKFKPAIFQLD